MIPHAATASCLLPPQSLPQFSLPTPPSAAVTRRDTQPVLEQLLANTCEWILAQGCVTTGTMSLLRQVGIG
jgi:hypothetical protein